MVTGRSKSECNVSQAKGRTDEEGLGVECVVRSRGEKSAILERVFADTDSLLCYRSLSSSSTRPASSLNSPRWTAWRRLSTGTMLYVSNAIMPIASDLIAQP